MSDLERGFYLGRDAAAAVLQITASAEEQLHGKTAIVSMLRTHINSILQIEAPKQPWTVVEVVASICEEEFEGGMCPLCSVERYNKQPHADDCVWVLARKLSGRAAQ
jgi:hypothetical protein